MIRAKRCGVEREQATNAMLDHRRDDVDVVDLTTAATMGSEEVKEAVECTRQLLGNIKGSRKFRTSAIAVAMVKPAAVAWGRVTVARYSRSTCGLTHRAEPSPSNRVSAVRAATCCVAEGRVAYTSTFVSTKTGSAAIVAIHVPRRSEMLPSQGSSWVGKPAVRSRFSARCGRATVIVTSRSPGGTAGGGGEEMRWSGSTPNSGANVGHGCSEQLVDSTLGVFGGRGGLRGACNRCCRAGGRSL
jgi:hypothetical protein